MLILCNIIFLNFVKLLQFRIIVKLNFLALHFFYLKPKALKVLATVTLGSQASLRKARAALDRPIGFVYVFSAGQPRGADRQAENTRKDS